MMRRLPAVVAALALAAAAASGRDWPSDRTGVSGPFGADEGGAFRAGIRLSAPDAKVGAWTDGEVVWASPAGADAPNLPGRGLVAVEHADHFRSLYRGIEVLPSLAGTVRAGETLGYAGATPWLFTIVDADRERAVNPLDLLPVRTDRAAPSLAGVVLARGADERELADGMRLPAGDWTVAVDWQEPAGAPRALPLETSLFWVGQRLAGVVFDSLAEKDGVLVLLTPDPRTFDEVYDARGRLILGKVSFSAGQGVLEIRFRDETGRTTGRSWRITVSP